MYQEFWRYLHLNRYWKENEMRLRFFLSIVILLMPSFVFAQSAKDAYKALKKIDLQTERAINYKEYKNFFIDAKLEFDMFSSSKEAKSKPILKKHLERAIQAYEAAADIWTEEIKIKQQYSNANFGNPALNRLLIAGSEEMGDEELKKYSGHFPDLNNPKLKTKDGVLYREIAISALWREASKELRLAYDALIGNPSNND
jgi:hypothetical protein